MSEGKHHNTSLTHHSPHKNHKNNGILQGFLWFYSGIEGNDMAVAADGLASSCLSLPLVGRYIL